MGVGIAGDCASDSQSASTHRIGWASRGALMLDLFYMAVVIAFFVLLWGFTRASERM